MQTKTIVVLNGHPAEASLSRTFAETYAEYARDAGHKVRLHHLPEMAFDMDFGQGNYKNWKPLEPELEAFLVDLEWSTHVVVTLPMWWGGLPAKLKALFDRALLPGRAFDPRKLTRAGLPAPLLEGKTARVIMTSDTPGWLLRLIYHRPVIHQINKQILGFVGIRPTRHTYFAPASEAPSDIVEGWIARVARLGAQAG
ncbi:MAG: NAD(P)H-dependent oxidoreductase [Pseudomonadota bacterium]